MEVAYLNVYKIVFITCVITTSLRNGLASKRYRRKISTIQKRLNSSKWQGAQKRIKEMAIDSRTMLDRYGNRGHWRRMTIVNRPTLLFQTGSILFRRSSAFGFDNLVKVCFESRVRDEVPMH